MPMVTDFLRPRFGSSLANLSRPLDIRADLRQQVVEAGEGPGGAEPGEEVELDGAAVEVAVEADEVGLDLADLLAEGRVRADVAGGRPLARLARPIARDEGPRGVDAVGGDERVDAVEVDRRDADARTPPGAVGDDSADPVGAARGNALASSTLPSRIASRIRVDEISSPPSLMGSTTSKSIPASRHHWPRIWTLPWRSWPKAKLGPSTMPRASNWRRITRSKNSRADRSRSHRPVWNTATSVAPASFSRATSRSGQTSGTGALSGRRSATGWGSNVTARAGDPGGIGPLAKPADQALMAPMNAVEVADRHIRTTGPRGEVQVILDRDHRHPAPHDGYLATGDRSPLDRTSRGLKHYRWGVKRRSILPGCWGRPVFPADRAGRWQARGVRLSR